MRHHTTFYCRWLQRCGISAEHFKYFSGKKFIRFLQHKLTLVNSTSNVRASILFINKIACKIIIYLLPFLNLRNNKHLFLNECPVVLKDALIFKENKKWAQTQTVPRRQLFKIQFWTSILNRYSYNVLMGDWECYAEETVRRDTRRRIRKSHHALYQI